MRCSTTPSARAGSTSTSPSVRVTYLAFTLGMTYQVSETDLQTLPDPGNRVASRVVDYLLGVVVLATVINLVAGSGSSSGG